MFSQLVQEVVNVNKEFYSTLKYFFLQIIDK